MNLESVIFFFLGLIVLIFLAVKASKYAKSLKEENKNFESKGFFTWLSRGFWFIIAIIMIIMVDRFGIINIPNPFSGPTVSNTMPPVSYKQEATSVPVIEATDGRPNMKDIRNKHQDELNDFEGGNK